MFYHLLRFGLDSSDLGCLGVVSVIFFYCILIGRHIEKKRILSKLSFGFLVGAIVCEVLFYRIRRMGPQMLLMALQFLSVPACLAFGLCFLVRYMQEKKKDRKEFFGS